MCVRKNTSLRFYPLVGGSCNKVLFLILLHHSKMKFDTIMYNQISVITITKLHTMKISIQEIQINLDTILIYLNWNPTAPKKAKSSNMCFFAELCISWRSSNNWVSTAKHYPILFICPLALSSVRGRSTKNAPPHSIILVYKIRNCYNRRQKMVVK